MKRTFLSLVGLLVAMLTMAGPVSLQQAQQRAQQFLGQRGAAPTSGSMRLAKKQTKLEQATSASADAYYYVFNVGEQQGFVIVSGDDRTEEILGYADSGSFAEENMPDNMRAWLEGYQDQMRWMDEHNYQPGNTAPKRLSGDEKGPLLSTTWDQDEPYNNNCPKFQNTSELCVTGCVATAMAQVLAYYGLNESVRKPAGTTKVIPAYECSTNWTGYGHMSVAEKPITTFDWANMLTSYSGTSTDAQKAAVAKLMEYCGASVQMNYGNVANGGSGANSGDVAPALRNYFAFDATYVERQNYSLTSWEDLIYSELVAERPVYFSGHSSGGGHAFVVDGFKDGLFHVNWGWGSHCDGYFVLSILNSGDNSGIGASTSNDGYSFSQAAIIGVKPGTGQGFSGQLSFNILSVSSNQITAEVYNESGEDNIFEWGVGYVSGGVIEPLVIEGPFNLENGSGFYNMPEYEVCPRTFTIDGSNLEQGTYPLVCISRVYNENNPGPWLTKMSPDYNYIEAVVDAEKNVSLTQHPVPSLSVSSFSLPGTKVKNDEQPVEATITNSGDEFYGVLYLFASQDENEKGSYKNRGGCTIGHGQTTTMQFSFKPNASGTWHLWVATDSNGKNCIAQTQAEISVDPYVPSGTIMLSEVTINGTNSWELDSEGNRNAYLIDDAASLDLVFKPTVLNISGDDLTEPIKLQFSLEKLKLVDNSWEQVDYYGSASFTSFSANSSVDFVSMSTSSPGYGTYRFVLKLNDVYQDTHYVVHYGKAALPIWSSSGNSDKELVTGNTITIPDDVTAVNLSGVDLSKFSVTANNNDNTLYFLGASQTIPDGLSGKNVVMGTTAETITISEGNDFYSPIAFTVTDKISYKRTFSRGYSSDGKGWSTISLPFSVTKVTTDNGARELDWFHNTSDAGKNFYLMAFTSDGGSSVIFSHANTFEANTPYIIAVPGSEFGTNWSLVNKELEFSAGDKGTVTVPATTEIVSSGNNYHFFGTLATTSAASIYKLNDDGNLFQLTSNASEVPFRAYFTAVGGSDGVSSLGIGFGNGTSTGIGPAFISTPNADRQGVYSLSGVKVADGSSLDNLPAGIYVINGKKVIK